MNLLLELLQLHERYRPGAWSILPATMALYNRRTVDIITACSEWKDDNNTILVCKKREGAKERTCFVSSSGDAFNHWKDKIGQSFETVHDQTQASKGTYKLVNVVVCKDDKIVKKANEEGIKEKASLSVFK